VLQRELKSLRGFVFGVGDMASIIQDSLNNKSKEAILSYRFDQEPSSTVDGVMKRIVNEVQSPDSLLDTTNDFLSFVCDQLNFARIIDQKFRSNKKVPLSLEGASVRNLNVIAAFELCNALGDASTITLEQRIASMLVLEKALAIPKTVTPMPVTFDECTLYLDFVDPITDNIISSLPKDAVDPGRNRILGQQHIDKSAQPGKRKMVGAKGHNSKLPNASKEYLRRMREADLIIMGAGSLISSQLSQLVIPGVVDVLLECQNKRRILVLNHVKMDETLDMTLEDHVRLIEDVALEISAPSVREQICEHDSKLRISDLFSDIVVPRTVAQELEEEMVGKGYEWVKPKSGKNQYITLPESEDIKNKKIYRNKYVDFLRRFPELITKYHITMREMEILSFLDQPMDLYNDRSETGRYRGALFASNKDIAYLTRQGIQRRSIHEVDSIGKNIKFIKTKGNTQFENFPGLIPQSLMGIFQLALEKGM
jgi:hypothetical protein